LSGVGAGASSSPPPQAVATSAAAIKVSVAIGRWLRREDVGFMGMFQRENDDRRLLR
jgi:hypothetical protein